MPVSFVGEKPEEEPGGMSRVLNELRPVVQNAVRTVEGEVHREGATSLLVVVPEIAEEEAEDAISEAVSNSLMDIVHKKKRVTEYGGGIISGGTYSPPVID